MNEYILDVPMEKKFHFNFQDGEVLLWESGLFEKKNLLWYIGNRIALVIPFSFIIIGNFYMGIPLGDYGDASFFIIISMILIFCFLISDLANFYSENKKYFLTNQRVVFQINQDEKFEYLGIPLTAIKSVKEKFSLFPEYKTDIYFDVKNMGPNENLEYFREDGRLTMKGVHDTSQVVKLIHNTRLRALL